MVNLNLNLPSSPPARHLQHSQADGSVIQLTGKAYSSPFGSDCLELPDSRLRAFDLVSMNYC